MTVLMWARMRALISMRFPVPAQCPGGNMKFFEPEQQSDDGDIDFNSFGKKRGDVKKENEAEKEKRLKRTLSVPVK